MLVIVAALGAAAAWGIASTCDNRSTRLVGAMQAMAWVQLIGLAMVVPFAVWEGAPSRPSAGSLAWVVVGGVGITIGITFGYGALSRGAVSVVAPVMAIEGALAALLSVALGEHIAVATAAGLAVVVAGMLAVMHATAAQERAGVSGHSLSAVLLAGGAAIGFAVFLVGVIRVGDAVGDGQLQVIYRIVPFAAVGIPLLVRGKLGRPVGAWAWLTAAAALQTAGFVFYRVAGRSGDIAIPSVLASQFAVFAIMGGVLMFGERLSRRQIGGLAGLLAGVAVVAGTHA